MGTIEVRGFRCQRQWVSNDPYSEANGLRQGRVSERSKKAGWHHVRLLRLPAASVTHTRVVLIDIHSTADEVPAAPIYSVSVINIDPQDAPFASVKIFYRPRGTRIFRTFPETLLILLLELLMAEGVITSVGARIGGGSEANDGNSKRAREGHSPGPSTKRRTGSTVKKEELSAKARARRMQALQVSRVKQSVRHAVAPDRNCPYRSN